MALPTVRSRLLLLTLGSMVPLVVLIGLLATVLFAREHDLARDGALGRMRVTASAVDALLSGHLSVMRALASHETLAEGDLAAFRRATLRVQADQAHWRNLLLVDATGQQRLNVRLDDAQPLPREGADQLASLAQVLATGRAHVGDVASGPLSKFVAIPLQIRVEVGGEPMVLKLILDPAAFSSVLSAQGLPGHWATAVLDGNGRFVARLPYRPPGQPASEGLVTATRQADSGWQRVPTLDGTDSHQAFARLRTAPWSVAVAVPRDDVLAGVRSAGRWLTVGVLASLLVVGGMALWVSRRIADPMRRLAVAARGMGGADVDVLHEVLRRPGFSEAGEVARALEQATASMREREALLQREQSALREADRAKDEFLAMLGHELRNPLSAVTNSAHLLRRAPPGADGAERAHEVIERQTRQMTRLVEDLLDISRLATGKLRLELERHDLAAVVAEALPTWQQNARRRGQEIRFGGAPAWALLDRARIEQILGNLLDNALKFSPAGSAIDVEVSTQGEHAVLTVKDHGQGIQADDLPKVFDTFYQASQLIHRPQGGLGLGLSLVQRLARLNGGDVQVHSDGEGRGAVFTVRLPSASVAGAARPAAADDRPGVASQRVAP
ncbi:MAG TPA: ATP-binding protein [Burkholderiaceae bacterium]|nr:ATP-binding protein [Burkholderiaceae bacterium]